MRRALFVVFAWIRSVFAVHTTAGRSAGLVWERWAADFCRTAIDLIRVANFIAGAAGHGFEIRRIEVLMVDVLSEQPQRSGADDAKPFGLDRKRERPQLEVCSLELVDVKLIRASRISDARGYFCETFQRAAFHAHGIGNEFLQDNQSASKRPGTIRGLHFQRPPFAQAKLVRVLRGHIFDVAVDLRRSSPTFVKHVAIELNGDGEEQLLIPAGFAHGFCTLEPDTIVFYKVDQIYSAAHDAGVNWADPGLAIEWPVAAAEAVLSEKDRRLPMMADLLPTFE